MAKEAELPCICCGKKLENIDETATNHPYGGTVFISHGHYGSTAFDPMNGEYLEITICDDCLRGHGKAAHVLIGRNRKPVTHNGSRIGWARADHSYVHWTPDLEHDDDDIEIDSWEEWQRLRETFGLESWFNEQMLQQQIFAEVER